MDYVVIQSVGKIYLSDRKQYVNIENSQSKRLSIHCGVPQGSILGPKLFILYIIDLCNVSKLFNYILFADDTNLFCSDNDIINLGTQVSEELKKLKIWFAVYRLSLNIKKTIFTVFSKCKYNQNITTNIDGIVINKVSSTKFLGIHIDDQLTWREHINTVYSKVSKVYQSYIEQNHC